MTQLTGVPRGWEATIYCCSCGCHRNLWLNPRCPDCGDWQFGNKPNPQHQGWIERQKAQGHATTDTEATA